MLTCILKRRLPNGAQDGSCALAGIVAQKRGTVQEQKNGWTQPQAGRNRERAELAFAKRPLRQILEPNALLHPCRCSNRKSMNI